MRVLAIAYGDDDLPATVDLRLTADEVDLLAALTNKLSDTRLVDAGGHRLLPALHSVSTGTWNFRNRHLDDEDGLPPLPDVYKEPK